MPVPSALVTRFFQLVVNRQFTEAERELERVKQKMHKTEWNRGYFRALYGMMLAQRSNNNGSYAFFSKMDFDDKNAMLNYKREFAGHVKSRLHGDFDRGFFSAWSDCLRVLSRINIAHNPKTNDAIQDRGKIEDLKDDKSQATMEKFL